MFYLSEKSLATLKGVDASLVAVVKLAITLTKVDFKVGEGLRTVQRQRELVAQGKSKTMRSKHIEGKAVDLWAIVDGKVSWEWKYYEEIAKAMKQAAKQLKVNLVWGGDWKTFRDGVHFQIGE